MSKRKYGKCLWCGRTIDVTNSDRELCDDCSQYPSDKAMIQANIGKKEKLIVENPPFSEI